MKLEAVEFPPPHGWKTLKESADGDIQVDLSAYGEDGRCSLKVYMLNRNFVPSLEKRGEAQQVEPEEVSKAIFDILDNNSTPPRMKLA